jgi:tetratricopeptide (TPR) repeat protein
LNHHYRFGTLSIPEGLLDPKALWGLLLIAILVAAAVWYWRKRLETAPALALLLVLLPLAPSLHAVSVTGVLFAERFLYIPVAGLALVVAWALQEWAVSAVARKAAGAVLAFVIVLFGGMTFARVGDWASMERLARSSIASYPNGSDVWKQLGLALVLDNRHGEAVTALARAVEINPRDAQAWMVYADALKGTGRYDEAFEALEKVIELAPAEPGVVLREAGQLRLLAGHAEQAIAPLVRAHELMPADARSLFYLVQAYLRSGEPEAAVTALQDGERAVQTDPERLRPLLGQAMLRTAQQHLDNGRTDAALSWTRQATQLTDLPPPGLFLAGMVAKKAGDEELAKRLFGVALSRDPELLRTKHDTAVRLIEAGTFDEAIALLEEVLAAEPEHAPSLFNLGRALLLAGRPAEAIEPLERGLRQMEDERARSLLEQARAEAG